MLLRTITGTDNFHLLFVAVDDAFDVVGDEGTIKAVEGANVFVVVGTRDDDLIVFDGDGNGRIDFRFTC